MIEGPDSLPFPRPSICSPICSPKLFELLGKDNITEAELNAIPQKLLAAACKRLGQRQSANDFYSKSRAVVLIRTASALEIRETNREAMLLFVGEAFFLEPNNRIVYINAARILGLEERCVLPNGDLILGSQQLFLHALSLDPKDPKPYIVMADKLEAGATIAVPHQKERLNAKQLLATAISLDPADSTLYLNLALRLDFAETVQLADGKAVVLQDLLLKAIDLNPTNIHALSNLVVSMLGQKVTLLNGKTYTKLELAQHTLSLEPSRWEHYYNVATNMKLGQEVATPPDGAVRGKVEIFKLAFEKDPRQPLPLLRIAKLIKPTESVQLLDGRTLSQHQLFQAIAERDPRFAIEDAEKHNTSAQDEDIREEVTQLLEEAQMRSSVEPLEEALALFGGDVNSVVPIAKRTFLQIAATMRAPFIVEYLVDAGADVHLVVNDDTPVPLLCAAAFGCASSCEILIKSGTRLESTNDIGQAALHLAVEQSSDVEVIRTLVRLGCDPNTPDREGFTPLHFAARHGKLSCIRLLLELGADIERKTFAQKCTPLMTAIYHGHHKASMLLLELGADVNSRDDGNHTPLNYARMVQASKSIVELIERGGVTGGRGKMSTLPEVEKHSMQGTAAVLSDTWRRKPKKVDFNEDSSFVIADSDEFVKYVTLNDVTLFKKLVQANPRHNLKKLSQQLLQVAVHSEALNVLQYFIDIGLNFHGVNGKERTPLMDAVQYGYEDVVKLLLRNDVDVNRYDEEKWTASSISIHATLHTDFGKANRIIALVFHTERN